MITRNSPTGRFSTFFAMLTGKCASNLSPASRTWSTRSASRTWIFAASPLITTLPTAGTLITAPADNGCVQSTAGLSR